MASKEFTEEEKKAMQRKHLDWRWYELVWRSNTNFIVRHRSSGEMQTVNIEAAVFG